jgi:hypothetical protein
MFGLAMALATGLWLRNSDPETPAIRAVFPLADAAFVPRGTKVQVSLDRPLAGVDGAINVRLRDANGARVTGALELHRNQTAAMFTPNAELIPGQYQAEARVGQGDPFEWQFTVLDELALGAGDGGPILVVTSEAVVFDAFYAEILRAEGLTSFTTIGLEDLNREILYAHQVAIVTGPVVEPDQVSFIEEWLEQGGNLIAMRPHGELAALAGLQQSLSTIGDGYLRFDTSTPPGQGLVAETIQFHGTADIAATTPETKTLASLYTDAVNSAHAPALTIREIGTAGGEIAAFTFDLAQSVVLTRQGNPNWAGQERDGLDPVRPNDLFFGGTGVGAEPDFIDLNKVAIPQADEKMRLLSNLIAYVTRDTAPLAKFWYFPKGAKAVLVMAADDHGTKNGTEQSFDRMLALGPQGCQVATWECPRATSWMYASSGMGDHQAAAYGAQGFEIGSHASTYCHNWSGHSLNRAFFEDLHEFHLVFPSVPPQQSSRLHCIVWSDYAGQPYIERAWNIRYDMNYYYWPRNWVDGRAGFMTGSGLPMRFSDEVGQLIDVYQHETHLVDEVFAGAFEAVEALIDRALGPEAYYGAFGTHFDFHNAFDVQLMGLAVAKGVNMVSVQQMLDWIEGRNASFFGNARWEASTLSFEAHTDPRTGGMLLGMLPRHFGGAQLLEIRRDAEIIPFDTENIKGIEYSLFSASTGSYVATYG